MKTFNQLIKAAAENVREIFPWDLADKNDSSAPLIVDVREPYEFEAMHIKGSINVPRGILETACEYDFEETVPTLVKARNKPVVVVCRSGNRSIFVAAVMQKMGYTDVISLKTGLRGWNDAEYPLVNSEKNTVEVELADEYFTPKLKPEQLSAK